MLVLIYKNNLDHLLNKFNKPKPNSTYYSPPYGGGVGGRAFK